MLRNAYNSGVTAALSRFKLALDVSPGVMGADPGVAPRGDEQSHGTTLLPYPFKTSPHDPSVQPAKNQGTDFLWNLSTYDKLGPGMTGEWGQEVIG